MIMVNHYVNQMASKTESQHLETSTPSANHKDAVCIGGPAEAFYEFP